MSAVTYIIFPSAFHLLFFHFIRLPLQENPKAWAQFVLEEQQPYASSVL